MLSLETVYLEEILKYIYGISSDVTKNKILYSDFGRRIKMHVFHLIFQP